MVVFASFGAWLVFKLANAQPFQPEFDDFGAPGRSKLVDEATERFHPRPVDSEDDRFKKDDDAIEKR
jgi:hypothetical protein